MLRGGVSAETTAFDWRAAAERLAGYLPPQRWEGGVVAWMEARPPGEPWAVACSGGPDSLATLLLAWAVWPQRRSGLRVLHFNHRVRGAEGDADAAFCRAVAARLGVEFRVGVAEWEGEEKKAPPNEQTLRAARMRWIGEMMTRVGAKGVFFGHQRDDVVETMLMRLARGSGTAGLAAPRPLAEHGGHVRLRPLLSVPRAEIEAALAAVGAVACDDATNRSDDFLRNRLRKWVVPAWQQALPAAVDLGAAVAASRAALAEDDAALEAWVDRVLPAGGAAALAAEPLALERMRDLPVAVVRRAVARWWHAQGLAAEWSRAAMEELVAAVVAGRDFRASVATDPERWVCVRNDRLRVEEAMPAPTAWRAALAVGGALALPDGGRLEARPAQVDASLRADLAEGAIDPANEAVLGFAGAQPAAFLVRTWQPGDRYRPLGLPHATKLQDQFVNRRIPREQRGRLPVVEGPGGEIAWVPGLPCAEPFRVGEGTRHAVRLTYLRPDSLSAPQYG